MKNLLMINSTYRRFTKDIQNSVYNIVDDVMVHNFTKKVRVDDYVGIYERTNLMLYKVIEVIDDFTIRLDSSIDDTLNAYILLIKPSSELVLLANKIATYDLENAPSGIMSESIPNYSYTMSASAVEQGAYGVYANDIKNATIKTSAMLLDIDSWIWRYENYGS